MNIIPNRVSRTIVRNVLKTKKNSPHIFFVGGVIGMVGSTVLACRSTLKLEEVVDEISADVESVKYFHSKENDSLVESSHSNGSYLKDLGLVYGKSAAKVGRLYGPSILLGVASVGALTGSHVQLTRRNAALTATLAAVSEAFEKYRIRVADEIGKEKELDIHRGLTDEEVEIDGKKRTVKTTDSSRWSPYARIFDESNPNWRRDAEYNRMFISCQEQYANHLLQSRGHIFLNDVYDSLNIERSPQGAVVGWLRDGDELSDGHVDFGMHTAYNRPFAEGMERSVILDFNVDGVIYTRI